MRINPVNLNIFKVRYNMERKNSSVPLLYFKDSSLNMKRPGAHKKPIYLIDVNYNYEKFNDRAIASEHLEGNIEAAKKTPTNGYIAVNPEEVEDIDGKLIPEKIKEIADARFKNRIYILEADGTLIKLPTVRFARNAFKVGEADIRLCLENGCTFNHRAYLKKEQVEDEFGNVDENKKQQFLEEIFSNEKRLETVKDDLIKQRNANFQKKAYEKKKEIAKKQKACEKTLRQGFIEKGTIVSNPEEIEKTLERLESRTGASKYFKSLNKPYYMNTRSKKGP